MDASDTCRFYFARKDEGEIYHKGLSYDHISLMLKKKMQLSCMDVQEKLQYSSDTARTDYGRGAWGEIFEYLSTGAFRRGRVRKKRHILQRD